MHCVPVDICWAADQVPEAQRWKEVPEIQFHWPSVLQLPVKTPELEADPDPEPEGEEVVTGAGAGAEGDTGSGSAGALDGVASGTGATDTEAAAVEALSAGAEEEPEEAEPEEAEPDELEPEEPEEEEVLPSPPKVGVPVQAAEPSLARLAG